MFDVMCEGHIIVIVVSLVSPWLGLENCRTRKVVWIERSKNWSDRISKKWIVI